MANNTYKFSRLNTAGTPFRKVKELWEEDCDKVHKVLSLYINDKGMYDPAPVAVCDGYKINLPSHLTNAVEEILGDIEAVAAVKAGHLGIKLYDYENDKGDFIGCQFVDI